ncbi:MAG: Ig-like domain-containing protein, partial [Myxococcales bacterium]|nr:Ig-like domain-containing protein [Myxococcales bacterium]
MREERRRWTLSLALAALTSLSCTKKEEEPPAEQAVEVVEPAVPALDLWAGVPPLTPEADDVAASLEPRPEAQKPPSVHETIEVPLAAPEEPGPAVPPATPGELSVERHGPTGAQGLVDAVRLSFDQPMVPLADVTTLTAKPIPFTIEPAVPGKVRWLGTRTLAFEPEGGRMPFSTEYTVTVPAGVKSTWGKDLAADFRWTFSTPTLALASSTPWEGSEGIDLTPTITLEFNQPVERTALVAALSLAGRGDRMGMRLAPPPKKASTPTATEPEWKAARRVEVVPERALRPNTRYTLSLPGGVYGEGPERGSALALHFSTYPPLTVKKAKCWGTCWANHGITLEASNPLDDPDIASKVHVDPAPADLVVSPHWSGISLSGDFEGGTRYRVTVDAGLRDTHGQTLARDFSTTVTLGPPYPSVSLARPMGSPVVIEEAASKDFELLVAGVKTVELMARGLALSEVRTFLDAYPSSSDRSWPTGHDPATYTDLVRTPGAMKRSERLRLDLAPVLAKGGEHVWLNVRSNPIKSDGWTERYGTNMLVEVTDLGVATALDHDSGLVMVTRLSTGEPVAGAKVSLSERWSDTKVWTGETDAEGLARMSVGVTSAGQLLLVEHADWSTCDDHQGTYELLDTETRVMVPLGDMGGFAGQVFRHTEGLGFAMGRIDGDDAQVQAVVIDEGQYERRTTNRLERSEPREKLAAWSIDDTPLSRSDAHPAGHPSLGCEPATAERLDALASSLPKRSKLDPAQWSACPLGEGSWLLVSPGDPCGKEWHVAVIDDEGAVVGALAGKEPESHLRLRRLDGETLLVEQWGSKDAPRLFQADRSSLVQVEGTLG